MSKLETALSLEQILEGIRQLSDQEKRALASDNLIGSPVGSICRRVRRQPDLRAGA